MKRAVIIRPAAEADILEAKLWYEERRSGLGEDFIGVLDHAFLTLEENAKRYPYYYRGFRRVLLRRFPYKVFYRIEVEQVIVFRVLHVRREHKSQLGE